MVKLDLIQPIGYTESTIKDALCQRLPIEREEIGEIRILRQALKADDKTNIHYKLTVGASFSSEREQGLLKMRKLISEMPDYRLDIPNVRSKYRPVIVGSGPCGMFAALYLSYAGLRPIILERGKPIEQRCKSVSDFIKTRQIDPESNIQFGEGGAGTFSDGKLKVGALDKYKDFILRQLVNTGAPGDVLFSTSAHVGTDKLRLVVKNVRDKIESLGGEYIFNAEFIDFEENNSRVKTVKYLFDGAIREIETEDLILAIGHSARNTVGRLYGRGFAVEARGFGVGMRIEHPREYINTLIYGSDPSSDLPTASYHLVTHLPSGRSVYSFCMCPGGTVVAAASEAGGIVTNGMSEYSRMADNSNSALLVSLTKDDFLSDHPLAGFDLQRKLEMQAFVCGGGDFSAPVTRLCDLLERNSPHCVGSVNPSYPLGYTAVSPREYLPDYVCDSISLAMSDFDQRIPGFSFGDAVLTGAETRSTSPVRMLRTSTYEALGFLGVYPCGEGAGYSGGIISSAYDGVRVAEVIAQRYQKT